MLCDVCCVLCAVRWLLIVARCSLRAVCLLFGVCCLFVVNSMVLLVGFCFLFLVCWVVY